MKYSIIACAYANASQFKNFLLTAVSQDYKDKYEIIIGDNATPNSGIFDACYNINVPDNCSLGYFRIKPEERIVDNNTQGLNIAAKEAIGKNLIIVIDSNVLLSYNLLSEIDKIFELNSIVTSSGCDVKISPLGTKKSEYSKDFDIILENKKLLSRLGWPKDPLLFDLNAVSHRFPLPHNQYDVYVSAIKKELFFKNGGYDESDSQWGLYHENLIKKLCMKYKWKKLNSVKIVHQFHYVYKDEKCKENYYSNQFKVMQNRKT